MYLHPYFQIGFLCLVFLCLIFLPKIFSEEKEELVTTKQLPSSGEKMSCEALRELTNKEVIENYRPDFLKNPNTNRNLELDCYCPSEEIGIEFQGNQHYQYPNNFHKTFKDFEKQIERDKIKLNLCKENSIHLIHIPYTLVDGVKKKNKYFLIKNFINRNLIDYSIKV